MKTVYKPKTIQEIEDFPAVYKDVQKRMKQEWLKDYQEVIVQDRLQRLRPISRFVIEHTYSSYGLIVFIVFLIGLILQSLGVIPREVLISMLSFASSAGVLYVMIRNESFKSSPSGSYRFYLTAEYLIGKWAEKEYEDKSLIWGLEAALNRFKVEMKAWAAFGSFVLIYLNIDNLAFEGGFKVFDLLMDTWFPNGEFPFKRIYFFVLISILFGRMFYLYAKTNWLTQTRNCVEIIRDKQKTSN